MNAAAMTSQDALYIGVSTKMYMGYARSLAWLEQLVAEVDARPALAAGRVVPFVIPSFRSCLRRLRWWLTRRWSSARRTVVGPTVPGLVR